MLQMEDIMLQTEDIMLQMEDCSYNLDSGYGIQNQDYNWNKGDALSNIDIYIQLLFL